MRRCYKPAGWQLNNSCSADVLVLVALTTEALLRPRLRALGRTLRYHLRVHGHLHISVSIVESHRTESPTQSKTVRHRSMRRT